MEIYHPKTAAAAGVLALLWMAEGLVPFYAQFPGLRERLRHDGRNLTLGLVNAGLVFLLFGGLYALTETWSEARRFGLLRHLPWPSWALTGLAVLALDLWIYLWHRANHSLPFLWRFHRMHHSDPQLDASSGVRFHAGEVCLSALIRLPVVAALGITLWQVALYEAIFLPVVLFHHSNVRLPRWLDRGLLFLIVTPFMHRVHHSRLPEETDSNYGSLFPYWDFLARTLRLRKDPRQIRPGLDGFDEQEHQDLLGMLGTPFRASSGQRPPRGGELPAPRRPARS